MTDAEIDAAAAVHDRRCTDALLAMLRDETLSAPLRTSVASALGMIDDHRAHAPLRAMLEDARLSPDVRRVAASALGDMEHGPTPAAAEVRSWWQSGDATLCKVAVAHMTVAHEDLLLPLLDAPDHPLHADAVEALTFGFEHPRYVERAVAAISHPDARVRRAAVKAVLFTEPIAAIGPLRARLDDPDVDVTRDALNNLAYYESREALVAIDAFALRTPDVELRKYATWIVAQMAETWFGAATRDRETPPTVRAWLDPVRRLVEPRVARVREEEDDEEEERAAATSPPPRRARPTFPWCASVAAFRARFADENQAWRPALEELYACNWESVPKDVRAALGDAWLQWPDPVVRHHAAHAFEAWRDQERLIALVGDPCPMVATTATYRLGTLGPHARGAIHVRERLERLGAGTRSEEALRAYVDLAAPAEWQPLVRDILADDTRPAGLRRAAAYVLDRPDAEALAMEAMQLLAEPPAIEWSLHMALLDAARVHHLTTPDLSALRDADDLRLQEALGRYLTEK